MSADLLAEFADAYQHDIPPENDRHVLSNAVDAIQEGSPSDMQHQLDSAKDICSGVEVLFEATALDGNRIEEEDFGDFENAEDDTAATTRAWRSDRQSHAGNSGKLQVLGLDSLDSTSSRSQPLYRARREPEQDEHLIEWSTHPISPHVQKSPPIFAVSSRSSASPPASPPRPLDQSATSRFKMSDDGWRDYITSEDTSVKHTVPTTTATTAATTTITAQQPSGKSKSEIRVASMYPTNIPPPSTLLALFPALLTLPKEIADEDEDADRVDWRLRMVLGQGTIAARILAGRRLRWKRDPFLSQAHKIGPASVGGGGRGMKLAGLDKSETLREEREASEVVRIWRSQVGRLRAAATAARHGSLSSRNERKTGSDGVISRDRTSYHPNTENLKTIKIPDLASTMPVFTITSPNFSSPSSSLFPRPATSSPGIDFNLSATESQGLIRSRPRPRSRTSNGLDRSKKDQLGRKGEEKERCCALCGLHRHERVRGTVDEDVDEVEDILNRTSLRHRRPRNPSEDEDDDDEGRWCWWVDFWGHGSCRTFWMERQAALVKP